MIFNPGVVDLNDFARLTISEAALTLSTAPICSVEGKGSWLEHAVGNCGRQLASLSNLRTLLRQLYENDVPQRGLSIVCDADSTNASAIVKDYGLMVCCIPLCC
jgi:hypothetical protein